MPELTNSADVKPHSTTTIQIGSFQQSLWKLMAGEAYLTLTFTLKHDTNWASAGHRVAFGQLPLTRPASLSTLRALGRGLSNPRIEQTSDSRLSVSSATGLSKFGIDLATGALTSWMKADQPGKELLSEPLTIDFYRAMTDNDQRGHGWNWIDRRVHQAKHHIKQIEWKEVEDGLVVKVLGRVAPPVLAWSVELHTTYHFHGDSVSIRMKGKPQGLLLPETFARIGITTGLRDVQQVRWWGRGPGESYRDKKLSQAFGNWEATVNELWTDYEFPQDTGNRMDVRWVEFIGDSGRILRAQFGDLDGASFSAMHYTTKDVDECTHPYELHKRKRDDSIVRLDWIHHGLGTASCGPETLPEYQLRADEKFDFEIMLD